MYPLGLLIALLGILIICIKLRQIYAFVMQNRTPNLKELLIGVLPFLLIFIGLKIMGFPKIKSIFGSFFGFIIIIGFILLKVWQRKETKLSANIHVSFIFALLVIIYIFGWVTISS